MVKIGRTRSSAKSGITVLRQVIHNLHTIWSFRRFRAANTFSLLQASTVTQLEWVFLFNLTTDFFRFSSSDSSTTLSLLLFGQDNETFCACSACSFEGAWSDVCSRIPLWCDDVHVWWYSPPEELPILLSPPTPRLRATSRTGLTACEPLVWGARLQRTLTPSPVGSYSLACPQPGCARWGLTVNISYTASAKCVWVCVGN